MGKGVAIISGSARRRGNSALLAERFGEGAREAGHHVSRIDVARLDVSGCLGCGACQRNGGTCVQRDEMEQVRNAMLTADVIVLASPVYFYNMCAQLKAVLDRSYAFFRMLAGKKFYLVLAGAAPEESYAAQPLEALRGFVRCVPNAIEGGHVIGTGCSDPGDARGSDAYKHAYELGLEA